MIADLRPLVYLESRQIVNRIRETARQPARAVMYAVVICYFILVGVLRGRSGHTLPLTAIPEPYASALFLAYVTLLGIMMYGAASGIVGAFSCAADARFLGGSPISERMVVLWLQMRRSAGALGRMLLTMLLYAIVFSRSGTFAGIGLAIMGGTIVATATAIPMLKLRKYVGTPTAQSLAGAIAAIGILPMVMLLGSIPSGGVDRHTAAALEHFGAGYAFNQLFDGRPIALAALYAAGALLVGLSYVTGSGLYPDLYASSLRVLAFRERQRRAGAGLNLEHRYEHRSSADSHRFFDMLRGPWTIVWKEWIAFMRSPSMQRMFVFGLGACIVCGAVLGHVVAGSKHEFSDAVVLASVAGNTLVIFVAMGSAMALSGDIAKPLWWMGRDPLWLKLFAWIAGTSWRLAFCVGACVAVWGISIHAPAVAIAAFPAAAALTLYLRAVGLVIYSLFPSTFDQRGPLALLRALLTYVLAAPPAILTLTIVFVYPKAAAAAVFAGIACSLLETMLLVLFAAGRVSGQGAAFARAETL